MQVSALDFRWAKQLGSVQVDKKLFNTNETRCISIFIYTIIASYILYEIFDLIFHPSITSRENKSMHPDSLDFRTSHPNFVKTLNFSTSFFEIDNLFEIDNYASRMPDLDIFKWGYAYPLNCSVYQKGVENCYSVCLNESTQTPINLRQHVFFGNQTIRTIEKTSIMDASKKVTRHSWRAPCVIEYFPEQNHGFLQKTIMAIFVEIEIDQELLLLERIRGYQFPWGQLDFNHALLTNTLEGYEIAHEMHSIYGAWNTHCTISVIMSQVDIERVNQWGATISTDTVYQLDEVRRTSAPDIVKVMAEAFMDRQQIPNSQQYRKTKTFSARFEFLLAKTKTELTIEKTPISDTIAKISAIVTAMLAFTYVSQCFNNWKLQSQKERESESHAEGVKFLTNEDVDTSCHVSLAGGFLVTEMSK